MAIKLGSTVSPPGAHNVKSYGALGDGTTNDGPAIQTAIDAAVAAGGGVVYFPAGTYKSTAKLTCGAGNLGNGAVTNLTNGTVTLYIELELLA